MGGMGGYLARVAVLPAPSSAEYASVSRIVEDYLARFGVLHSFGVPEVGENLVASCGTQPEVSLQACKVVTAAGDAILKAYDVEDRYQPVDERQVLAGACPLDKVGNGGRELVGVQSHILENGTPRRDEWVLLVVLKFRVVPHSQFGLPEQGKKGSILLGVVKAFPHHYVPAVSRPLLENLRRYADLHKALLLSGRIYGQICHV